MCKNVHVSNAQNTKCNESNERIILAKSKWILHTHPDACTFTLLLLLLSKVQNADCIDDLFQSIIDLSVSDANLWRHVKPNLIKWESMV